MLEEASGFHLIAVFSEESRDLWPASNVHWGVKIRVHGRKGQYLFVGHSISSETELFAIDRYPLIHL